MWEIIKDYGLISQWFGLGLVGLAVAVFIIIDFPLLRHYAIGAIVFIVASLGIYSKGIHDNAVLERAKQAHNETVAIKKGVDARKRATRSVDGGLRDDGYDRDKQ